MGPMLSLKKFSEKFVEEMGVLLKTKLNYAKVGS
jgi:hypothetical protein